MEVYEEPLTLADLPINAQKAINATRERIANEYRNLSNHNGGEMNAKPLRIMLVTTWKSGSTFLGELLGAGQTVYYDYEPLFLIGACKEW